MNTYSALDLDTAGDNIIPYIEKQVVYGKELLVYIDNYRSEDWFGYRGWLRKTKDPVRAKWFTEFAHQRYATLIKKGDVVLDCGANEGYLTLLFATCVGETGHVYSFEPNPKNIEVMKKTLELNGIKNVTIVPAAVTETGGEKLFFSHEVVFCDRSSGSGELGKFEVPTICLNDYAKYNPNFVKVDVEGYELPVIRGAKDLLKGNVIFEIELHLSHTPGIHMKDWYGFDPDEIYRIFRANGYSVKYNEKEVNDGEEPKGAVYCTKEK